MKIKKFRAIDSQQAMRQIRAEVGPDASILTCYQVPEGIEFVVAMDAPYLQEVSAQSAATTNAQMDLQRQKNDKPVPAVEADMASLREELGSMRNLLEKHLKRINLRDAVSAPGAVLHASQDAQSFQAQGFSTQLEQRLVALLPERAQAEDWALALDASLSDLTYQALPVTGAIAFVGAPGAGKTQLLATLALQSIAEGKARHLHLISMDNERFGAREQLQALGRALGVSVSFAADALALREQLAEMPGDKQVLIDTAGVDIHDPASLDSLGAALAFAGIDMRVLVLAADRQRKIQEQTLAAFSALEISGLVVTWADSLSLPGELASWLLNTDLPWFGASLSRDATQAWMPADRSRLIAHTLADLEFPAPLSLTSTLTSSIAEPITRWRWNSRSVPA